MGHWLPAQIILVIGALIRSECLALSPGRVGLRGGSRCYRLEFFR